jgi:hypothetical protein
MPYAVGDGVRVGLDTKEGEAMKKNWLRGILLGVSLALLLAGGVALAQSLDVRPDCFQCFPGTGDDFGDQDPGYPYSYNWESCGWEPGESLYYRETFANGYYWDCPGDCDWSPVADDEGCIDSGGAWGWTCQGDPAHHPSEVAAAIQFPDDFLGPFEICVEYWDIHEEQVSADQIVCETIDFAEECPAEFVPEPGTIALLGSGLVGLAGYATLRWRTRE